MLVVGIISNQGNVHKILFVQSGYTPLVTLGEESPLYFAKINLCRLSPSPCYNRFLSINCRFGKGSLSVGPILHEKN